MQPTRTGYVESNGVRLFVDPISVRYLKGAEVDFVDSTALGVLIEARARLANRQSFLLAAPGRGDALSKYAAENYPVFSTIDFSTMTAPALVVAGKDLRQLFVLDPDGIQIEINIRSGTV